MSSVDARRARPARGAGASRRSVRRLVALFVALPFALFGVPAAVGVTWLVGDNLIQNFPLRVLVGTDLRHGHLPLWDPYLWSGSPLLSAFNAGAAYPTTWLFAVLPGVLAWVVNQAVVEVAAAAGMLLLLRVLGRSWTAAGLGALSFAYGGFMAVQALHIDVVQAAAWLPWAFAALDRIAHRPQGRSAVPWVALLAGAIGLMGLSGAAEPILDGGVVLAVYALWLIVHNRGRRIALVVASAVGVGVGLLLAGAQLVPGALIQSQSQRAVHDYWYFGSGSMNKSLTLLGLDPFIFGANHAFSVPFFATYNLSEVSSYIGIVPVMALVGLLARRHRRHPEARQWRIWYGILALGLILTWGDFTPLGHVFFHLPLFNRQRLLSRNILEVDLALAVLFATWVDHMLLAPTPTPAAVSTGRWWQRVAGPGGWRSDIVLPLVPVAALVGLQIVMLAGGTWLPHFAHVPGQVTRSSLLPLVALLTVPSALAIGAAVLVLRRAPLRRLMPRLLGLLVLADLVFFNVFVQGGPNRQDATSSDSAWANALAAVVVAQGPGPAGGLHRVAIFDPDRYYPLEADRLGEPDLNIVRGLPSVQGYGAVVDATYDRATGTHRQLSMTAAGLGNGTFARLDLGVLASVPEYFVHLVTPPVSAPGSAVNGSTPLPPVGPTPGAPADRTVPPPTPANAYDDAPAPAPAVAVGAQPRTQFFGTVLSVTAVTAPVRSVSPGAGPSLRVGLLSPDGRSTTWIGEASAGAGAAGSATVEAPRPMAASGIVLQARTAGTTVAPVLSVGTAVVRTEGQGTYRVDGSLRDLVAPGQWRFVKTIGPFTVFDRPSAPGRAWVEGVAGATAHVVSSTPWGDESIRVTTTRPARLVRSEQFATGWQATVTPVAGASMRPTGPTRSARVRRAGLVEAVRVPAGTSEVRFVYRPHRVTEGLTATGLGVLALVLLGRWPAMRRRLFRHEA